MATKPLTSKQREARDRLRAAVGQRLKIVREVLGLGQGEFGRRAGLTPQGYSMIEAGDKLPSIESAMAMCDAHGLTLDYIFRGDAGDLKHSVGRAVEALMEARSSPGTD